MHLALEVKKWDRIESASIDLISSKEYCHSVVQYHIALFNIILRVCDIARQSFLFSTSFFFLHDTLSRGLRNFPDDLEEPEVGSVVHSFPIMKTTT
ncbi:hypothetical protein EGR_07754 [Echinococcus granulosus]|uniref:Uncharacterized protein n=1 Tax=Echinococcus granulosus TaxID=6210 RepID=W6UA12_ECHGR|nr:hypothetical protein EGR_07754 [Echinococcus granulosus]EUB57361.1 hypothetical protein EGR_07754 [Echinococcus granulosus]